MKILKLHQKWINEKTLATVDTFGSLDLFDDFERPNSSQIGYFFRLDRA